MVTTGEQRRVLSYVIKLLVVQTDFRSAADKGGRNEFSNCLAVARSLADSTEPGGGDDLKEMFLESDYFCVESFENV